MLREIKTSREHYFEDELGRKQGEYTSWWYSGEIFIKMFFRDGLAEGEAHQWVSTGQQWYRYFYKNGNIHGEFKEWHANGELAKHCFLLITDQFHLTNYRILHLMKNVCCLC